MVLILDTYGDFVDVFYSYARIQGKWTKVSFLIPDQWRVQSLVPELWCSETTINFPLLIVTRAASST